MSMNFTRSRKFKDHYQAEYILVSMNRHVLLKNINNVVERIVEIVLKKNYIWYMEIVQTQQNFILLP